jgi:hypothetical protein
VNQKQHFFMWFSCHNRDLTRGICISNAVFIMIHCIWMKSPIDASFMTGEWKLFKIKVVICVTWRMFFPIFMIPKKAQTLNVNAFCAVVFVEK